MPIGTDDIQPQKQQRQPGLEHEMRPEPDYMPRYPGSGRLAGRVALVTGGDSGIGRAVCVLFAREGADIACLYKDEHEDAEKTRRLVEAEGRRCLVVAGDIADEPFCRSAVKRAATELGRLDVLVNNAAVQYPQDDIRKITTHQLEATFKTNLFSQFWLTQAALDHLPDGGAIVNTTSITAYRGSHHLIDYAATKGAIVAFTRSLATALVKRKIRVNGVAAGPIWTPLIPASFDEERVAEHGASAPMGRPGQPWEVATCHLFLACEDGAYMTGQVLHPNGGTIIGG